jgi:hypothetical protein
VRERQLSHGIAGNRMAEILQEKQYRIASPSSLGTWCSSVRVRQGKTKVVRVGKTRVDIRAVVTAEQDLTVLLVVASNSLLHFRSCARQERGVLVTAHSKGAKTARTEVS